MSVSPYLLLFSFLFPLSRMHVGVSVSAYVSSPLIVIIILVGVTLNMAVDITKNGIAKFVIQPLGLSRPEDQTPTPTPV